MTKSHKKSKKRKRGEDSSDDVEPLYALLSHGVLKYPDFLQDFNQIVTSLDKGKSVSVEEVENEQLRSLYNKIFAQLPLFNDHGEWAKRDTDKKPLNSMILSHLLKHKCIKQPRELTSAETWSVRISKQILQVFTALPQLQTEFRFLLQKLVDGEDVDVSGIDNAEIKRCLEDFFEPLGLDTEYKDVYALPDDKYELKSAMLLVLPHLELAHVELREENSDSDGASTSDGSASNDNNSNSEHEDAMVARIGPAMPSRAQLAAAAEQAQLHYATVSDDESDDIGPTLPAHGEAIAYIPRVPVRASSSPVDTSGREEWMLTPGKSNSFEVQALSGTAVSRKFQHGKEARKSAEVLQAQRDAEEEAYRNSEEGKRTQALLDEYREKRGPSLMEIHHLSGAKRPDARSRGFNRDEDMAMHRKLNKHEAEAMVEQSKTLDSRFNRSIEKSFL